jgi:hypothetical protein
MGASQRSVLLVRQIFPSGQSRPLILGRRDSILSLAVLIQWPVFTRLWLHVGPTFAGPARQSLWLEFLPVHEDWPDKKSPRSETKRSPPPIRVKP